MTNSKIANPKKLISFKLLAVLIPVTLLALLFVRYQDEAGFRAFTFFDAIRSFLFGGFKFTGDYAPLEANILYVILMLSPLLISAALAAVAVFKKNTKSIFILLIISAVASAALTAFSCLILSRNLAGGIFASGVITHALLLLSIVLLITAAAFVIFALKTGVEIPKEKIYHGEQYNRPLTKTLAASFAILLTVFLLLPIFPVSPAENKSFITILIELFKNHLDIPPQYEFIAGANAGIFLILLPVIFVSIAAIVIILNKNIKAPSTLLLYSAFLALLFNAAGGLLLVYSTVINNAAYSLFTVFTSYYFIAIIVCFLFIAFILFTKTKMFAKMEEDMSPQNKEIRSKAMKKDFEEVIRQREEGAHYELLSETQAAASYEKSTAKKREKFAKQQEILKNEYFDRQAKGIPEDNSPALIKIVGFLLALVIGLITVILLIGRLSFALTLSNIPDLASFAAGIITIILVVIALFFIKKIKKVKLVVAIAAVIAILGFGFYAAMTYFINPVPGFVFNLVQFLISHALVIIYVAVLALLIALLYPAKQKARPVFTVSDKEYIPETSAKATENIFAQDTAVSADKKVSESYVFVNKDTQTAAQNANLSQPAYQSVTVTEEPASASSTSPLYGEQLHFAQSDTETTEYTTVQTNQTVKTETVAYTATQSAAQYQVIKTMPDYGDDKFTGTLTDSEREQFLSVFAKSKFGLPDYIVGTDNKLFFKRLFIYLGKFRHLVSDSLMEKMYLYVRDLY